MRTFFVWMPKLSMCKNDTCGQNCGFVTMLTKFRNKGLQPCWYTVVIRVLFCCVCWFACHFFPLCVSWYAWLTCSVLGLAGLKHLRKLNLNSTSLSALTFEGLKVSVLFQGGEGGVDGRCLKSVYWGVSTGGSFLACEDFGEYVRPFICHMRFFFFKWSLARTH